MSQADIQKVLQEKKGWISTKEITLILKTKTSKEVNHGSVWRALKTMERFNEVVKKMDGRVPFWKICDTPQVKAFFVLKSQS